jgi:hypothetical protein
MQSPADGPMPYWRTLKEVAKLASSEKEVDTYEQET